MPYPKARPSLSHRVAAGSAYKTRRQFLLSRAVEIRTLAGPSSAVQCVFIVAATRWRRPSPFGTITYSCSGSLAKSRYANSQRGNHAAIRLTTSARRRDLPSAGLRNEGRHTCWIEPLCLLD